MMLPTTSSPVIVESAAETADRIRRFRRKWNLILVTPLVLLFAAQFLFVSNHHTNGPDPAKLPVLHPTASGVVIDDPGLEFSTALPAGFSIVPNISGRSTVLELVPEAWLPTNARVAIEIKDLKNDTSDLNDQQLRESLGPKAGGPLYSYSIVAGAAELRTADGRLALPVLDTYDSDKHVVRVLVFHGKAAYLVSAVPPGEATAAQLGAMREALNTLVTTMKFRPTG